MKKLLLILPACLLLAACEPAAMAAFTGVGVTGAYVNHVNKGAPLSAEDTKAAIKEGFGREQFESFELNK